MTVKRDAPPDREELLNALYASVSEVPAWVSFARAARDAFECDQAAVMIWSEDGTIPVGAYADELQAAQVDALFVRGAPSPRDGLQRRRSQDNGEALLLHVVDSLGRQGTIVLCRSAGRATFDVASEALLLSLAEPLRRSLQIYYRFTDLVRRESIADLALNTSRIGAVLVGRGGELMLCNEVAEQLLAAGGGLRVVRGRLQAESIEETRDLIAEIERCAANQTPVADRRQYAPMAFSRSDHPLPLTVIIRPGPGFRPLREPLRRTAILVLRDPAVEASWPAATLATLFGLTAAEAMLASELAKGANLEEVAANFGVSRNTVRSQLQSIFLKTGLNRQSDLIRALLNSAATSA